MHLNVEIVYVICLSLTSFSMFYVWFKIYQPCWLQTQVAFRIEEEFIDPVTFSCVFDVKATQH